MKNSIRSIGWVLLATLLIALRSPAAEKRADGIKTANLKGANLELMANHDPASQLENFVLLPGYEVNLFAANPMLANPIHMMWDARGRLWVACSWAYPQLKPGAVADDKIIILEDTDGDGVADKSTVFADGLYIPTGIELANGGCYVAQSPDVFFFKDTDGDDVADVKELALTGFGIEDSHHSISAWRRGPGGWIYFQEGIFLHTQVETQHGVVRNFNGGVYQYNPRSQELRMFAKIGVGNPWGHVFDRWGQSFFVDNPRVSYLSPSTGNSGEKVVLEKMIQTEKQCGGDLATGTHLPEDIRGQLLTCRFKSRSVVRYEFIEDGAGFRANVLEPLIASKHPNFRPVDCKVGPDGGVYVADWYNSIINHAQHDFRDPRRDHEHGRIWRITAKNRPLVVKPDFENLPLKELVGLLASPEDWIRHQVRNELTQRETDLVEQALSAWVAQLKPTEPEHDHHLVEAMWAFQNIERPNESVLKLVLNAKDGHARSAGARVIRYWHASLKDPVSMIAELAADTFPRTRMEAILSAGFIPQAEALPAALRALDHPLDRFIEMALPQTVLALQPYWEPALATGNLRFSDPTHLTYAEREAGLGFDKQLASFLRKRKYEDAELAAVKTQIVTSADAKQVRKVIDQLASKRNAKPDNFRIAMLSALEEIGRRKTMNQASRIRALRSQLGDRNDQVVAAVARNLGVWDIEQAGPDLVKLLFDENRSGVVREGAAEALGYLGRAEYADRLRSLAVEGDIPSRYYALHGLLIVDIDDAVRLATELFKLPPGDADPVALVRAILLRSNGARQLQEVLKGQTFDPEVSSQVAAFHRRTGQLPGNIARAFESSIEQTQDLNAMLMKEQRAALVAAVEELGDPRRGEEVFRRSELACISCHGIGPVGPAIGPNLVAVGAGATTDYVVEAILEPNKSIAEHYENMLFTLNDGTVRMGVITFKSEKRVTIRDSMVAGNEITLRAEEIKRTRPMPSLMPAGLVNQLQTRQEFLDLSKFVSLLGRPGAYANDERPFIRKWRVLPAGNTFPAPELDGMPAYSLVNGALPISDIFRDGADQVFVRGYLEVQMPGAVNLLVNDPAGLKVWVGNESVKSINEPVVLKAGRQVLTFSVDANARGATGLKVEVLPAAGSAAKVQPEGGL